MTLPAFPSVSPDPVISDIYIGDLALTLSPTASDGLDAYSISRLYDPNPTNAWVATYRIPAVNSPADGYITGDTFVMPSSELPSAGSSYTYYIYAYRFAAGGGDAQYFYSSSFTITRSNPIVLPNFPDVIPNPVIASDYVGNLNLYLSPTASDGLDAYSISRLYDPNPTNQFVADTRIPAVNSPADGYVTGDIFEMPANQLPTAGNFFNYYIYAYRFPAGDGEGQYYYSDTFSITRQTQATSVESGLEVIGPDGSSTVFGPNFKICNITVLNIFSLSSGASVNFFCDSVQFANKVAVIVETGSRLGNEKVTVTRLTNTLRLTNTSPTAQNGEVLAIRIG
jgi:hypothetical protein